MKAGRFIRTGVAKFRQCPPRSMPSGAPPPQGMAPERWCPENLPCPSGRSPIVRRLSRYNPPMRENDFLHWTLQHCPPHPTVPLSIGDDMAAVVLPATPPNTQALLKIDQCLDQVHFDLRHHTAAQAGTKAVNRSEEH